MVALFKTLELDRLEAEDAAKMPDSLTLTNEEMAKIRHNQPTLKPVPTIDIGNNWDSYRENLHLYLEKYELDMTTDPLEQLLSPQSFQAMEKKFYDDFGNQRWNKWDYTIVGLAALVGFLVDVLIVKLPAGAADKYVPLGQKSTVGKWVNRLVETSMSPENNQIIKKLESWAKTPYDAVQVSSFERIIHEDGKIKMNANLHRLKTPGHDPILQLVFGVLDCMYGTISVFDQTGKLAVLDNPNYAGTNLFTAVTKTLAHFLTDVGTTRGVVPPFFSLSQAIVADTPFDFNDRGTIRKMKFNELSERMYTHGGYNFNHFLVMALTPLSVEAIIRSYRWLTKPSTTIDFKRDYKLQSMLTMAHSLTMSTNVMKMWLSGWNPLAFNYAQLLMLVKTFFSYVKSQSEYNKIIENTLLHNWQKIYKSL